MRRPSAYTDEEIEVDRLHYPERDDLIRYIYTHIGKFIPNKSMCEDHNAPAEFIEHILYGEGDIIACGCRSGGKTMQFGMACGMLGYPFTNRPNGVKTRELGGSADQSKRVYEEFIGFLETGYHDKVMGDILTQRTAFQGGGRIELMTQSTRSVRGPHVPRLLLDEIDEFDRTVFLAALSIPQSQNGVSSMVAMASTRHRAYGLMKELFDDFVGVKLIWCIYEILEKCTEDYSCASCNLSKFCPGKKKMSNARGYLSIEDARKQRNRIKDDEIYESEALCRKPRTEGSIYPKFGIAHQDNVPYDPAIGICRSFDYGTDHPTVCGYWQLKNYEGRKQARMIDELRWRGTAPSTIVSEMVAYENKMGYTGAIKRTLVPKDAAGFRAELENNDIGTVIPVQDVDPGIGTVRNLMVADKNEIVGIVFDKVRCLDTIKEMEVYHMKNGRVIKLKDDGPDQVRYYCHSTPELRTIGKPVIAMMDFDIIGD